MVIQLVPNWFRDKLAGILSPLCVTFVVMPACPEGRHDFMWHGL